MRFLGTFLLLAVLSVSCTDDPETLVSSPPPFADGYELIADQPYAPQYSNQLAVLVTRDRDMEPLWRHFQLGGRVPELREGDELALFVATAESSTCPIELEGVTVEEGNARVETADPGGPCTADARRRTLVFLFRAGEAPESGGKVEIEGVKLRIRGPGAVVAGTNGKRRSQPCDERYTGHLWLFPSSGPVGTRVRFVGDCFTTFRSANELSRGYGIFLIRELGDIHPSGGCEQIVPVEPSNIKIRRGRVEGYFTVGAEGACFQGQEQDPYPVVAGRYQVNIGCHPCNTNARFRVTD